jgi:hypothetical protein
MHLERLKLMSDMLVEVAAGTWRGVSDVGQAINSFSLNAWAIPTSHCGFSACAVGHATFDARFQAEGLHASEGNRPLYKIDETQFQDWNAVQHFFKIDVLTASIVFNDYFYENKDLSPLHVKARIDELMAKGPDALKLAYPALDIEDSRYKWFQSMNSTSV